MIIISILNDDDKEKDDKENEERRDGWILILFDITFEPSYTSLPQMSRIKLKQKCTVKA